MKWYKYLVSFFIGAFFINSVPHILPGLSGDSFPSPFADPPGKGFSSPLVNLTWGYFNLIVAYILYRFFKIDFKNQQVLVSAIVGLVIMSFVLCIGFQDKLSQ